MLYFDDKTLINNYRLPHNILQLAQHYRDQRKCHRALLVVVQVTNALRFFFAKGDFQSSFYYFVYLLSSVGCLVTDLRVDC